jgi:superfamily II DNA/RNA helicase
VVQLGPVKKTTVAEEPAAPQASAASSSSKPANAWTSSQKSLADIQREQEKETSPEDDAFPSHQVRGSAINDDEDAGWHSSSSSKKAPPPRPMIRPGSSQQYSENTASTASPASSSSRPSFKEGEVAEMGDDDYAADTTKDDVVIVQSFDDMGLDDDVLQGVYSAGFERPTPTQQRTIPAIITGRNVISQAPSGTGKTLAFSAGVVQRVYTMVSKEPKTGGRPKTRALVLSPTRELAEQSSKLIEKLTFKTGLTIACCLGGTSVAADEQLVARSHIVGGTMGRLIDLIERKALRLQDLDIIVLDEADTMLKLGFVEDVQRIMQVLEPRCQICLISATMTPETVELSKNFMNDPIRILIKPAALTLDGIVQRTVFIDPSILTKNGQRADEAGIFELKYAMLSKIYCNATITQAIIFCNSIATASDLHTKMVIDERPCEILHGKMTGSERGEVIERFRSGRSRILISTDVLARGIDVQSVSLVINFDTPRGKEYRETYLHRIGRSGRYGKKGFAILFVVTGQIGNQRRGGRGDFSEKADVQVLADLRSHYATSIAEFTSADFKNIR